MHYFLNIGSNIGNPKLQLSKALRALEAEFGYFEASKMVESVPWGFVSPNRFYNIGVMVISDLSPLEVLEKIKEIEGRLSKSPHRDASGNYADREIDIDIVAADEEIVDAEGLKIPHPHLAERRFFLEPMAELAPMWRHPVSGLTPEEMLDCLPHSQEEE